MRSVYDALKVRTSFTGIITGSLVATAVNGTLVDTLGLNTGMLHVYSGYGSAAGSIVVTLQEAADGATWTNALDNTGTVIGFTLTIGTTTDAAGSARIEGLGAGGQNRQRYLRAVLTPRSSSSAVGSVAATIIMGRAYAEPEFGGSTAVSNT